MKYTIHIPTEQFGFVEAEIEGTPIDACREYKSLSGAFRPQSGLPRVEWNKIVDKLFLEDPIDAESYEKMSDKQKEFYHEIEKAFERIKGREGYETNHNE